MRARAARWGAALACAVVVWGCGDDDGQATPGERERGGAVVGGEVVSTVDGMPITEGEVRDVTQDTGLSPADALDRLQERELLALEARRRGYGEDPQVDRAAKQALVQALLEREVEDQVPPESITDEAIRERFESRAQEAERRGITLEDAREDIREQLLIEARRARYDQLVQEIEERWPVQRNEQAIGRVLRAGTPEGS